MTLDTATYTAYRGYAWSHVPDFTTEEKLSGLYRFVSLARGDFPDPASVTSGMVSDGVTVGFFVIQNIERWDAEGRASDYAAFALLPIDRTAEVDFVSLLNSDFFWTPTHTPANILSYNGPASAAESVPDVVRLMRDRATVLDNPRTIGALLAKYGFRSSRWIGLMQENGVMNVECDPWRLT